jgi:TonB-dependent starch-binding outer membrane protein SusC
MRKRILIGAQLAMKSCDSFAKRAVFLTIAVFFFICTASAQNQKITINQNNKQLSEILNEIESKSGYSFLVRSTDLNLKQMVTINAKDKTISEILSILFKDKDINYEINGNRISIFIPQKTAEKVTPKNTKKITGVVTDQKGETIIGAAVAVKGKSGGTVTDLNGKFSINDISNDDILVFSFIGLNSKEVKVGTSSSLNVVLEEKAFELKEVVALGYTTQKRRDMIGSVAKITSEQLISPANTNFSASMQGKASGVYVSGNNIRIRGVNSISLSSQPLWIIDGVPGNASNLNPNDIESVTVLKDAAATALYGSSGANGVITVTTKSMKGKKSQISVELNSGISDYMSSGYDLMNTEEFINAYDLSKMNATKYTKGTYVPYDPNKAFDWNAKITNRLTREQALANSFDMFKEASRVGFYNQFYLSASKGFDKGSALFSTNYRTDEGQLKGISSSKLTTRVYFTYSPVENVDFIYSSINIFTKGVSSGATLELQRTPFMPLYDSNDPTGYWSAAANPIIASDPLYRERSNSSFGSNNYLKMNINLPSIKGLSIGGVLTANFAGSRSLDWYAKELQAYGAGNSQVSTATENFGFDNSFLYRAEMNYNRTFGSHTVGAFVMGEGTKGYESGLNASGYNLNGTYAMLGNPGNMLTMASTKSEGGSVNYIARATYKFKDRYLFEGNIRRDGISTLSENNRWATFPSLGLGWVVSDESFFKFDAMNFLKFRGSVGKTGNASVPAFVYLNAYQINNPGWFSYDNYNFTTVRNLASDVKWETSDNLDLGFDFGFLQNRINGSAAYYNKQTSGLLVQVPLPLSTGVSYAGIQPPAPNAFWYNIGNMKNEGYEFSLSAKVINTNNFSWDVSYNHTINENEVLSIEPNIDKAGSGIFGLSNYTLTTKGEKLATYYLPDFAGIDPDKGIPMIWERDAAVFAQTGNTVRTGNKIPATSINAGKNQFILSGKSATPDYYGGLRNTFKYKDFDFSVMITYAGGDYFIDSALSQITTVGFGQFNLSKTFVEDSWQKPGDNAKYPEMIYNGGFYYKDNGDLSTTRSNAAPMTNQYLKPGDNIQLREITFGYSLPKLLVNKLKIDRIRFYANVFNVAYWAKAGNEMNPEVAIQNNNIDGAQRFNSLLSRTCSFGFNLNF